MGSIRKFKECSLWSDLIRSFNLDERKIVIERYSPKNIVRLPQDRVPKLPSILKT